MCTLVEEVSHWIYTYIPLLDHLSSLNVAAPVMDTPSSSTVTVPGSSLTLSCTSRGSPPDTFAWRKDNDSTVLQSTSITAVDYNSTSAVFRADYSIDKVTASDNGTYTCIVINPIGNSNTIIRVVGTFLVTSYNIRKYEKEIILWVTLCMRLNDYGKINKMNIANGT